MQPSTNLSSIFTTHVDNPPLLEAHDNSNDDEYETDSCSSDKDYMKGDGRPNSSDDGSSSNRGSSPFFDQESSEVQEIRRLSTPETKRVRQWRCLVTLMMLATAVAVTVTTYRLLSQDEARKFRTAAEQFSRSLAEAALAHERSLRSSLKSIAAAISLEAATIASARETGKGAGAGSVWPFFVPVEFEALVQDLRDISKAEIIGLANVVSDDDRDEYIDFSNENYQSWIQASHMTLYGSLDNLDTNPAKYRPYISRKLRNGTFVPDIQRDYYVVRSTQSPPARAYGPTTNWNIYSQGSNGQSIESVLSFRNETVTSEVRPVVVLPPEEHKHFHTNATENHPHSFMFHPVHEVATDPQSKIVAILSVVVAWDVSMQNLLPETVEGLVVVVSNTCNQSYTYEVRGNDAVFLGDGDLHDSTYDDYGFLVDLDVSEHPDFASSTGHCQYSMSIYPSDLFKTPYDSQVLKTFFAVVAVAFCIVMVVFVMYDFTVYQRNEKLVQNAARTHAIVSSLFPGNLKDRVLLQAKEDGDVLRKGRKSRESENLRSFLADDSSAHGAGEIAGPSSKSPASTTISQPMADLFTDTTIMFADIVGFTAWSSVREPSQVFTLLETVFSKFDDLAKRRRVFKVETVGDCYVAVTGLPDPRPDHAVAMGRFARDCLETMQSTAKRLEVLLGPDTGDLSIRIGIHSGPVTAGVLRGHRSRFQLFGDTMNTAARMESTGMTNRIQVSQETADLLIAAGKGNWVSKRKDLVTAKGKGVLQTFWLETAKEDRLSHAETSSGTLEAADVGTLTTSEVEADIGMIAASESGVNASANLANASTSVSTNQTLQQQLHHKSSSQRIQSNADRIEKLQRLINWHVDLLAKFLKQVVARRRLIEEDSQQDYRSSARFGKNEVVPECHPTCSDVGSTDSADRDRFVIDEVTEILPLPPFDPHVAKQHYEKYTKNVDDVPLDPALLEELKCFVSTVAHMYRENPFHCFEHASHVTMSTVKLLARIVAPSVDDRHLDHDQTYGITTDPLTQFAVVFSALIHDVDHSGVPNAQLVKEQAELAVLYNGKSVAEQNSVDLAWDLLMDEGSFKLLRAAIFGENNPEEKARFRQLVVNTVMATDIADKNLKALRNARWNKAFSATAFGDSADSAEVNNRKATIVIEHLIQASDIAHTMQHWHIYRKWNQRFFEECHYAFKLGRSEQNPADVWYQGELGFFDFYIIPLAKKLKDCGVFGVSSDEYLNYALRNRKEWEARGHEVVAEMVEYLKIKDAADLEAARHVV